MILHEIQNWTCSHCNAIANFHVLNAAAETQKVMIGGGHAEWRAAGPLIRVFATCGHCQQPCMLTLRPKEIFFGNPVTKDVYSHVRFLNRLSPLAVLFDGRIPTNKPPGYFVHTEESGIVLNAHYTIERQFPESALQRPATDELPPDLNVELDDLEGVMSVPRYAMIGCRRIIERACKEKLGDNAKGKRLYDLIDATLNNLEVSQDLSSWAHALRTLGNDAVHDDGPSPDEEDARQALALVKFLLDLLFVSPARIQRLRKNLPV